MASTDRLGSNEIKKHLEDDYAGDVLIYRAGSKVDSHNLEGLLQKQDIMYVIFVESSTYWI